MLMRYWNLWNLNFEIFEISTSCLLELMERILYFCLRFLRQSPTLEGQLRTLYYTVLQNTVLHKASESTPCGTNHSCRSSHLPLCSSLFCLEKASGGKRTRLDWQLTRKTIHQNIITCRTTPVWRSTKQVSISPMVIFLLGLGF